MTRPKKMKSLKIAHNRLKSPEIAQKFLEIAKNLSKKAFRLCTRGRAAPRFIGQRPIQPYYGKYLEGLEPILQIQT